jgi:5-methylcytosine-specific restriction endonuclease McrA
MDMKLRRNGYRFLDKIIPHLNNVCPWCNKPLDIDGLKIYVEFMKNRKGGKMRIKRKNIDVDIDHKIPVWKGGTNDIENLQFMHPACNNAKGGREPRGYLPTTKES